MTCRDDMTSQQKTIKIGEVEVTPGSKDHGFLKAGELPASDVLVPFYIINGSAPGPILSLLAGVHSDEWQGMEAAVRIYNHVDPKKLSGVIISCPFQNLPGFQGNANIGDHGAGKPNLGSNPLDGTNLTFGYPGKEDGTISERIAYVIFNQIVLKADYMLDLHAGDVWEKIVPMTIYWITGNDKIDRMSEEMARAFPTDFILTIPLDGAPVPPILKCLDRGIPAMVVEAGNVGLMEESAIDFHFTGVLNVLKQFRMIEGSLERVISAPRIFGKVHTIKATVGGFYTCKVDVGQAVKKGETVGEIRSIFGEPRETLVSPIDGDVWFFNTWPPVKSGDSLIRIAERKS